MVVRGSDGATWYRANFDGWSSWMSLGGYTPYEPSVSVTTNSGAQAWAIGGSGAVYLNRQAGGAWGGWYQYSIPMPSGVTAYSPVVATGSGTTVGLAFTGNDHNVYYGQWNDASPSFTGWINLAHPVGTYTTYTAPSVTNASGVQVWHRGPDGELWYDSCFSSCASSGRWLGWTNSPSLTGSVVTVPTVDIAPAAYGDASGNVDLVVRGGVLGLPSYRRYYASEPTAQVMLSPDRSFQATTTTGGTVGCTPTGLWENVSLAVPGSKAGCAANGRFFFVPSQFSANELPIFSAGLDCLESDAPPLSGTLCTQSDECVMSEFDIGTIPMGGMTFRPGGGPFGSADDWMTRSGAISNGVPYLLRLKGSAIRYNPSFPVCGDTNCTAAAGEMCNTCPTDCGLCPGICGNGICSAAAGEDCISCPADCGACNAVCGDGNCDNANGETCANCPQDCTPCHERGSYLSFVSTTCGGTWQKGGVIDVCDPNLGMTGPECGTEGHGFDRETMAQVPSHPETVVVAARGTTGGWYVPSSDGGQTWSRATKTNSPWGVVAAPVADRAFVLYTKSPEKCPLGGAQPALDVLDGNGFVAVDSAAGPGIVSSECSNSDVSSLRAYPQSLPIAKDLAAGPYLIRLFYPVILSSPARQAYRVLVLSIAKQGSGWYATSIGSSTIAAANGSGSIEMLATVPGNVYDRDPSATTTVGYAYWVETDSPGPGAGGGIFGNARVKGCVFRDIETSCSPAVLSLNASSVERDWTFGQTPKLPGLGGCAPGTSPCTGASFCCPSNYGCEKVGNSLACVAWPGDYFAGSSFWQGGYLKFLAQWEEVTNVHMNVVKVAP